jgi:hypothetical protein
MKRLRIGALLTLGCVGAASAQTTAPHSVGDSSPIDFASTSAAQATLFESPNTGSYSNSRRITASTETLTYFSSLAPGPMLLSSRNDSPVAIPAEPAPAPQPVFGDRDDYRWQLGIGFAWERFRSSIFNASAAGINTSLSYFTNEWFAVEGSVSSVFAPTIFQNEHVKILNYGAGPRITWRQHRWEPFLHAIVGGTHVFPQTAAGSKNAFMISPGGGVDWRWLPRLSLRFEADYIRTSLYGESQNNFGLVGGFVFHF